MANYKPVLIDLGAGLVPLLNIDGNPVVYDADANPDGPPADCCCVPPCETCDWTHLEFYDQTNDCVCLPDGPFFGAGQSWSTATCPGNLNYSLTCDPITGLPVLAVTGLPNATLLSYTPCDEITFQLPALGANCGGSGGTAKARITP